MCSRSSPTRGSGWRRSRGRPRGHHADVPDPDSARRVQAPQLRRPRGPGHPGGPVGRRARGPAQAVRPGSGRRSRAAGDRGGLPRRAPGPRARVGARAHLAGPARGPRRLARRAGDPRRAPGRLRGRAVGVPSAPPPDVGAGRRAGARNHSGAGDRALGLFPERRLLRTTDRPALGGHLHRPGGPGAARRPAASGPALRVRPRPRPLRGALGHPQADDLRRAALPLLHRRLRDHPARDGGLQGRPRGACLRTLPTPGVEPSPACDRARGFRLAGQKAFT